MPPKKNLEKKVKKMAVGEMGYIPACNILFDKENNDAWIDRSIKISRSKRGEDVSVEKLSKKGYRVDIRSVARYDWEEEELMHLQEDKDFVKIKVLIGERVRLKNKMRYHAVDKAEFAHVLKPLDALFFPPELDNEVFERSGLANLLYGEEPAYSGFILHGVPGTGKSEWLRSIAECYRRSGAAAIRINLAQTCEKWIASFGRNLDDKFKEALEESFKRDMPTFLYIDEGTAAIKAVTNETEGRYYQEAIDIMKTYICNYRQLVVGVTTNEIDVNLDDALVREGRLKTIDVGLPKSREVRGMWKYFIKKHELLGGLTKGQLTKLTNVSKGFPGAFIEEICRTYISVLRGELMQKTTSTKLLRHAVQKGEYICEEELRSVVTFNDFFKTVTRKAKSKS